MMIDGEKCAELELAEPNKEETQIHYVARLTRQGGTINTRQARFIGIGNLHSIASALSKKNYKFTNLKKVVLCPFTKEIYPLPVIELSMTKAQRDQNRGV